jgi:WD40 repeat protein
MQGISHNGPISGIAACGPYIATAGYDSQVILWDRASGDAVAGARHDDLANQCAFSPDGALLATASSDASLRVFETPRMRLRLAYTGHGDDVMQVKFDPTGRTIASCSYDGTLHVIGLDGRLLARCEGHRGLIEGFTWSPDGASLRSCGTDGTIRTWNAATGACIDVLGDLPCDVDDILQISHTTWVAAMDSGALLVADDTGRTLLPAHEAGVKCLTRRGSQMLSIGYDQTYKLWSLRGRLPELLVHGELDKDAWARSACILDDGCIAFASFGSRYLVHDPWTGRWDHGQYRPSPSLNAVRSVNGAIHAIGDAGLLFVDGKPRQGMGSLCNALCVDGDIPLAAGQQGALFNADSGEVLYRHAAPINCIEPLKTEGEPGAPSTIVLGGYDGAVVRVHIRAGRVMDAQVLQVGATAVKGLSFDKGRLFCGLADGTLVIVDATSLAVLHRTTGAHDSILNGVSFFEQGFVTVSRDLTMRRWKPDGQHIDTIATRHAKSIKCVATSADGRYTATGSYAGTVDVFGHREGRWMGRLRRLTLRGVSSLTWCTQRAAFCAAGYDGHIYEVPCHGH